LAASNIDKTELTLTWTDNEDNETGYRLKENDVDISPVLAANATSVVRAGLISGQTYLYQLCAFDENNNEYCSDIIVVTTLSLKKPKDLMSSNVTKDSLTLTWEDDSDNEDGYKVLRNGIEVYNPGLVAGTGTIMTYADSNLSANTPFLYVPMILRLTSLVNIYLSQL